MLSIVLLLIIVAAAWFWFFHMAFGVSNPQLPTEKLSIKGNTWSVEMATSSLQQARGLSGRTGLGPNDGMLFVFNGGGVQNFWMKDMNFSLDMIWISGNTVAGFAQDAEPQPGAPLWKLKIYTSPYNVDKVLEVVDGTVAKYNIKVGDIVTIAP